MDLSVGRVARSIRVPASTVRTWERRYGLGPSARTPGGHRRYTPADVARLAEMARLVATGLPAHDAARRVLSSREGRGA